MSRRSRQILGFGAPEVPRFTCRPERNAREERRGSAQSRGYDAEWDKLSKEHRRREPMCRECYFRGRRRIADLTNHVIPVRDRPDLRLDRGNLSSMCQPCHDTVIRGLEALARQQGDIGLMAGWLADPATRPQGWAFDAKSFPPIVRSGWDEGRPPAAE